jgi:hypothetical protein
MFASAANVVQKDLNHVGALKPTTLSLFSVKNKAPF